MKLINKTKVIALAGLMILLAGHVSEVVYAVGTHQANLMSTQNSHKPVLEAYQSGNGVKAEWAVDILPQDVLYETGFEEGDELPNLIYGSVDKSGGRTGGQSFSTESPYSGLRSLRVEDTYSNGQQSGNPINGVVPFSNMSRTRFLEQKYVDNGIDLSLSLKVKTTANANIRAEAQGVKADYGIDMKETFAEDVKVGDYTAKVSDITIFKNTIDSGRLYYLADSKGQYNTIHAHSYDEANSTITVNRPFRYNFKKGDNVIQHRAVVPLSFPRRDVNSKEWTTINMNTKVPSYPYYDIKKRGFSFVLYNTTRGIMYIDDLKLGYATQTELYRDGQRIYQGKLSDFEDKQSNDKAKPDKVIDYNVSLKSGKQYINVVEPEDNGTQYNYQVKAISNDGSGEYWSDTKNVNVVTGIQGYSYVIDKNKNTNPSGNINSNNGEIEVDKNVYKDHYLHIQAIDGAGNKSEVSHIKLDKIDDITNPSLNLTHSPTKWTNDSVTIHADATDTQSGIKEIFVVGENTIRNGNFAEGEDEWEFVAPKDSLKIENGEAKFNTSGVSELRNTSLVQNEVLRDGLRNDFRINVNVKGKGNLNTRFRVLNTGLSPKNEPVYIDSDEYEEHVFYVPYDKEWADGIVIELLGNGYLYVNNVEMYETSEVKDGKIDVHENGAYEFSVVDNAGNVTTKSIEITNIDKVVPSISITPNITDNTHKDITLNVKASDKDSGVKRVVYIDDNMKEKDITDTMELKATKNGEYVFMVEDNAGNKTTQSFNVNNIVRELKFEGPEINENVEVTMAGEMNTETSIGNIKFTDWRDNSNNWKLTLEAIQLKNDSHTLPKGILSIEGVDKITKLDGDKSGDISMLKENKIIDDGPIEIVSSTNERGIYELKFKDNALKFNLTPDVVKKGTYNTKLTWKLESTPEIN